MISLAWEKPSDVSFSAIPAGPFPVLGAGLYQCATIFLDHYNISHGGAGASCLSQQVTVAAIDNSGDPIDPGNVTLSLAVNPVSPGPPPPKGNWTRVGTGSGILSNQNSNGTADYQFPGNGETSVTLVFNYTILQPGNNSETVNFDVIDTNGVTDTGDGNALTDPNLVMSLAGFQFYNEDTGSEIIPTQIAGKPSSVLPNDDLLSLRAVRVSDDDPTQCTAAFPDMATVTVLLAAECRNPTACAGREMRITNNGNTTPVDTNADNGGSGTTSYDPVNLLFEDVGGVSRAELAINYPDAGQIQLHSRYEIPLDETPSASPPAGSGSGGYMEGSSQLFIVRPFGLAITDIKAGMTNNPASLAATDPKFIAAGSDFEATVGAYLWDAADDDGVPWGSAGDGIPDFRTAGDFTEGVDITDNDALMGNALAPSFAWNGSLTVVPGSLYAPAGEVLGALNNGSVVTGDFSGGEATLADLQYTEVGTFMMKAVFNDYLGEGTIDLEGASYWNGQPDSDGNPTGAIGRFVPYDFDVSLNTPEFATQCGPFTYVGQPFGFSIDPVMIVTARAEGGSTTQNYTGSFNRLTTGSIGYPGGTAEGFREGSVAMAGLDTGLISGWSPTIDDNGDGSVDLVFSFDVNEKISFNRVAPIAPFDAEISLELNVVDQDGVFYGDGTGADLNPAKFGDTGAGQGIAFDAGKEQRWGRLTMANAVGSELLPVTLNLRAEYYLDDDSGFVLNGDDSCTVYQAADIGITDADLADTLTTADVAVLVPATETALVNGTHNPVAPLLLSDSANSAVGPGKTGPLQLLLDLSSLTGSEQDWLQFDWDDLDNLGDGPYDGNPGSRADFGIYRGPDSLIYIRGIWN